MGSLGVGASFTGMVPNPTPIVNPTGVSIWVQIEPGTQHTCALSKAGDAYCWGPNSSGNLGTADPGVGPLSIVWAPSLVNSGGFKWSALAVGYDHVCGIRSTNLAIYCWCVGGLRIPYACHFWGRGCIVKITMGAWNFLLQGGELRWSSRGREHPSDQRHRTHSHSDHAEQPMEQPRGRV